MLTRLLFFIASLSLLSTASAQQYVGLTANTYSAIQQMTFNPAWVNNSENGTEVHLLSFSVLAGSNAISLATTAGKQYKDPTQNRKYAWENIDIMGPGISFEVKDKHHFGISTRMRQIMRAGNLPYKIFKILGEDPIDSTMFNAPITAKRTGLSFNTFADIGVSYGQIIHNDEYHIVKAGGTLKYVMGFSAASVYVNNLNMELRAGDTVYNTTGDIRALYSYNINPYATDAAGSNIASFLQRAGGGGLGVDLGFQYEYHPNGTPNFETPYKYSIAVSVTDIGAVSYYADSGSGSYKLIAQNRNYNKLSKKENKELGPFLDQISNDSFVVREEAVQKFSMGLPTALRINTDWVASEKFNVAVNALLNLRGNGGDVYRPAYVSYLNITPSYGNRQHSLSIPLTFYGRQTLTLGIAYRYGPFYIGSSSLISTALSYKKLRNADLYFGLMLKFKKLKYII